MNATLYHHPFACSLASVIAIKEGGADVDIKEANVFTKEIQGGGSLFDLNPLGQVATLRTTGGEVITENTAILMWIQDHCPEGNFKRTHGTPEFYQLIRWLGFCSTEMHKSVIWPIMNRVADPEQQAAHERAAERLTFLDQHLNKRLFLVGETISVADCYLFWVLSISSVAQIDLANYSNIANYNQRLAQRAVFSDARAADLARGAEMSKSIKDWTPAKNPSLARA